MSNELMPIEEKYLPVLIKIRDMEEEKRELEDEIKKIKKQIEDAMSEYNVTSLKTSFMTIVKTKDSESITLDTKKLKEEDTELWSWLMKKYSKVTKKSGSVQFRLG